MPPNDTTNSTPANGLSDEAVPGFGPTDAEQSAEFARLTGAAEADAAAKDTPWATKEHQPEPNQPDAPAATEANAEVEADDAGEDKPASAPTKLDTKPIAWMASARRELQAAGHDVDALLGMTTEEIANIASSSARRALARDNTWSAEEIGALSREKLLEKGLAAAKRQRDVDAMLARPRSQGSADNRVANNSDGDDTVAGREPQRGNNAPARSREAVNSSDPAGTPPGQDALEQFISQSIFDPDAATRLRQIVNTRPAAAAQASTDQQLLADRALKLAAVTRFEASQANLLPQYPDIGTEVGFRKFKAAWQRLDPNGEVLLSEDSSEAFALGADAALLAFGPAHKDQARQDQIATNQRTQRGQPRPPTVEGKATVTNKSFEDLAYLAAVEANGDEAAFARKMSHVPKLTR